MEDVVERRRLKLWITFHELQEIALDECDIFRLLVTIGNRRDVDSNDFSFWKLSTELDGQDACAAADVQDAFGVVDWSVEWLVAHDCSESRRLRIKSLMFFCAEKMLAGIAI